MRFEFLRGACVIIEGGGKRVLCDPWLTDGIYYGSWAHYPEFTEWSRIENLDYIYVSHIHPDHFSPETMKKITQRGVPVLIHKFNSKFLRYNIESLGFEVRELDHNRTYDLGGGLKINILAADDCDPAICGKFFGCDSLLVGDTQIDSMAVFDDGKHVYVNANDCPYQLSRHMLPKIRLQYPEIDVLFVAYAGAGPYPQCFAMGDKRKKLAANLKKSVFVEHAIQFAKALKVKATFPFAGDYVLAGPLHKLNPWRGVASLEEVYDAFDDAKVPVIKTEIPDPIKRQFYISDQLSRRKYSYDKAPYPSEATLYAMCKEAFKRLEDKRQEIGFASPTAVYIRLPGSMARIPFNGGNISQQSRVYDERYIKMTVDPRLLGWVLAGPKHAHWNNLEIGSHIMFEREPDTFERGIHHLMSSCHV